MQEKQLLALPFSLSIGYISTQSHIVSTGHFQTVQGHILQTRGIIMSICQFIHPFPGGVTEEPHNAGFNEKVLQYYFIRNTNDSLRQPCLYIFAVYVQYFCALPFVLVLSRDLCAASYCYVSLFLLCSQTSGRNTNTH